MKVQFFNIDNSEFVSLPLFEGLQAGFPSPAEDFAELRIDLNKELVQHREATFFARVKGNSMKGANIDDGDVLIIDKSIEPRNDQIAVCFLDGEFTVKRLRVEKDCISLIPENDEFEPIQVTAENNFIVWGIVTYIIKKV